MVPEKPAGSTLRSSTGSAAGSPAHDLLTRKEAAYLLRLRPNTLAVWAVKGRFEKELPIIRLGRNLIRYRRSDIERFIESRAGLLPGDVE
uniref:Helix-turn-helix domain-containing protein n=2 Tax=Aromatoleum toluolicum TaxID=90060 RepID=A0ABX1NK86_9RHOO|nr:helix-turn-helix domain-containing protein [Aromatoleum toluolicum]